MRYLVGGAAVLLEGGQDARCRREGGRCVREDLNRDVEAVELAGAEDPVAEPVRVYGFLAEGALDGAWHFLRGGWRSGRGW